MNNIKTNVLFFVLMALIFMAYVAISIIHTDDLIPWLIQYYGWEDEKAMILKQYIREETWTKAKAILILLFVGLIYIVCCDKNILKEYKLSFLSFFKWLKKDFMTCLPRERVALFLIMFLFGIIIIGYHCITPIQLDELHTWLFFVNRGPLVTVAYYPSSNNHIGYNLLSMGWNVFLPPLWAIRIVSMLSGMGTVLLLFLILKRKYTFLFSIAGMIMLMCSAPFMWYAVQGRGYVLELFVLMVILYMLTQPVYDFVTDRLLVLCNAFVLYIVPVALIPLTLLNVYYAYRLREAQQRSMFRIIRTFIYSGVLTFFCYAPVIIFSGWQQLFNNSFVQRIAYNKVLAVSIKQYIPSIWDFISGCSIPLSLIILIVLIGGSVFLYCKKNKFVVWPIAILCVPFILVQFYPVLLFERTWLWLVIPFVYWVIEVLWLFADLKKRWIVIVSIGFFFLIVSANVIRSYHTNRLLKEHASQFLKLKAIVEERLQGKTLRVYDDVTYDYLLFYQTAEKPYTLIYSDQQPALKEDMALCDYKNFRSSDGSIVWTDQKKVLYSSK